VRRDRKDDEATFYVGQERFRVGDEINLSVTRQSRDLKQSDVGNRQANQLPYRS
jgi:hypothetical protein